ncbi:C-type lectin domain family 2 member D-like [Varanus komodoensis]|uniref:C-type lectin domain-containing protein n=1 Tax=Varanus komodoensis TaxID=61221 RepID=A0A8D2KU41_VARKO|nr:C-type lectin domain family 2 member D-like [Varanus komodoensis]XP_044287581.1 C-type lectin domain family 2 member D-like [Varanus komodoensis]
MNERRLSTSSLLSYDSPSVISSIGVQTNISKGSSCKAIKIVLAVISACLNVGLITWVIVLQRKDFIPLGPACPDSWIGYQGKCYYFSEEKRNWTSSQNFCMSYNSSLLTISCKKEKAFVMRFNGKNTAWIGLRREQGQPWKWTNGDNSTLQVIGNGGDCTFLNDEATITSSSCQTKLLWICNKSDTVKS